MFRGLLISLSKADWAKRFILMWKPAREVSRRFIAGETLEEGVNAVRELNAKGFLATLDQLGEDTTNAQEAEQAAHKVVEILRAIDRENLCCNISLKLSQIGLSLDEMLCRKNLGMILTHARELNNFVRIDMEGSNLTTKTINAYEWAKQEGYENVGIVLQSYLYRTEQDLQNLSQFDPRVRLCKGAYKEPVGIAFPEKAKVDQNFDRLTSTLVDLSTSKGLALLSQNGRFPPIPAIATHDEARVNQAISIISGRQLPRNAIEFQMLYGICQKLQRKLADAGYPVRIYVPFGTHWYPFFMRRLAERPANLWFFISQIFQR